jgi:16S rRNA (guanine527-N7)-methyltransferase
LNQEAFRHLLKQTFHQHGFRPTQHQQDQFITYWRELQRWNSRVNLTSIRDDREIVLKHFLDSLGVLQHFPIQAGDSVVDIGSGAGFPGLPLKIYVPDIELTLIESSSKKASFLQFLMSQLNLTSAQADVRIFAQRAEAFAEQSENLGAYDWVLTRYVASLVDSAPYCLPLLKRNGTWIAYKSREVEAEIHAASSRFRAFGGEVSSVVDSQIPELNRTYVATRLLPKNI